MKIVQCNPLKILTVFVLFSFVLNAQQKTGNIVEYFGKEKVNSIEEGELLHVFKTGLSLKVQNFRFNSASFPKNPVLYAKHFLGECFPFLGKLLS